MMGYLRTALAACRATGTEPSFLLHPLDLIGAEQAPALAFFPGMDLPGARKIALFTKVLRVLGESFRLVNMSTHARAILSRPTLPTISAISRQPSAAGGLEAADPLKADG